MRNSSHTRPVNLTVRIGNRPVELPWSSSALSGVPNRDIEAWLDRQYLSAPELGALASVLSRLSCPSDLTPFGDPQLGRVSKAAKKRLPAAIVRQIKLVQAKHKKLLAERKAKKQAAIAAKATQTPTPVQASPVPDTSPSGVTAASVPAPTPEAIKTEVFPSAMEPVVEPLISPEDKALPVAQVVAPVVTPTAMPPAVPSVPPVTMPAIPEVTPSPVFPPPSVLMPQPQVMVQVPSMTTPVVPPMSPLLPVPAPINPSVSYTPSVYPTPSTPSYQSQPTYPPRPNTPLPTEYSYGFDTEDAEGWDEEYEEVGAPDPAPRSAIGELAAGIGLIGALAWFAMRKT